MLVYLFLLFTSAFVEAMIYLAVSFASLLRKYFGSDIVSGAVEISMNNVAPFGRVVSCCSEEAKTTRRDRNHCQIKEQCGRIQSRI